MISSSGDHPYEDPGDGRTECRTCGKFVWLAIHSCKGVPVTTAAKARHPAFQAYLDASAALEDDEDPAN